MKIRIRSVVALLVTAIIAVTIASGAPASAQAVGRNCQVVYQEWLATIDALDLVESLPPGPARDEQIRQIEARLDVLGAELDTCEEDGVEPPVVVEPDIDEFLDVLDDLLDLGSLILQLPGPGLNFINPCFALPSDQVLSCLGVRGPGIPA